MCTNDQCILLFFGAIIFGFTIFIFLLLKLRKRMLSQDASLRARDRFQDLNLQIDRLYSVSHSAFFPKTNFLFGIWQDHTLNTSVLVVKDVNDQVVAQMHFLNGAREFQIYMGDLCYIARVNLTWSGSSISLLSPNNQELCRFTRRSRDLLVHQFDVKGIGLLQSHQSLFDFKRRPITYKVADELVAFTTSISSWRRIGRMGFFRADLALPVQVFILAIKS